MLTRAVRDPRAWTPATLDAPSSWTIPLSGRCRSAISRTIEWLRKNPGPATQLRVADSPLAGCGGELRPVRTALESGRGFAVITGLPPESAPAPESQALYWLLGELLGRPAEQNVQGTLLYDVRDTGQDVRYGARFSVTNDETRFHTDNSFGDDVVDYVGLLCVHGSKAGGLSQVASAWSVHNELLERRPEVLEVLYRPFHFDRRGGVRPGEPPTALFPVLRWDGREILCRYLRYWIEAGQEKAGRPLTPDEARAFDALEETARGLQAEFLLNPGDMFYVNNRWILHNRSAFRDWPEPARGRHYVRLWLKADHSPDR